MLRKIALISVTGLILWGCASAPSSSSMACPKNIGGYVAGEATSDFVKRCMGKPVHEDRNPDGRHVYLYDVDKTMKVAFLFDSSGKLIRTRGYNVN